MNRAQAEELEVKRKIDGCFDGFIDRDCEECLAHGDYGGPCCCGKKFDEYDDECTKCIHRDGCAEECGYEMEVAEEEDSIRIGPRGDRIRDLGPPIKTSIWDQLRGGRTRATPKPTRFTIKPRTGAISAAAPRPSRGIQTLAAQKESQKYIPMDDRVPIGDDDPHETATKRFVKDSTWGGGEGFFRAAYEFFRTHRLR